MSFWQFNLSTWLNQALGNLNSSPCPIQEGIPAIIGVATNLILWGAVIGFIIGMVMAVFFYLTAYGDEAKAKKAKDTFRFTILGALVVMLSYFVINAIANTLSPGSGARGNNQAVQGLINCGESDQLIDN